MSYLTVYKYKSTSGDVFYCNNTICFSGLYGTNKEVDEISVFLINGLPTKDYQHQNVFSIEQVNEIFSSLNNIIDIPKIEEISLEDIRKEFSDYIYSDIIESFEEDSIKNIIKIIFCVKNKQRIYTKFVTTFCRYFYEIAEENSSFGGDNYREVMECYYNFLKKDEYVDIPRIELFQLCHSFLNIRPGHGIFGSSRYSIIVPVKENEIIKKLQSNYIKCLNENYPCLFSVTLKQDLSVESVPLEKLTILLDNYLKEIHENTCARIEELC